MRPMARKSADLRRCACSSRCLSLTVAGSHHALGQRQNSEDALLQLQRQRLCFERCNGISRACAALLPERCLWCRQALSASNARHPTVSNHDIIRSSWTARHAQQYQHLQSPVQAHIPQQPTWDKSAPEARQCRRRQPLARSQGLRPPAYNGHASCSPACPVDSPAATLRPRQPSRLLLQTWY